MYRALGFFGRRLRSEPPFFLRGRGRLRERNATTSRVSRSLPIVATVAAPFTLFNFTEKTYLLILMSKNSPTTAIKTNSIKSRSRIVHIRVTMLPNVRCSSFASALFTVSNNHDASSIAFHAHRGQGLFVATASCITLVFSTQDLALLLD